MSVSSVKPLSIAFEEIAVDKIVAEEYDPDAEAEAAALVEAEAIAAKALSSDDSA